MQLLGSNNANLAADDQLYIQAPHVDTNGLAYLLDSPVVWANGVFQYANVTIWPQAKTESYAPEGLSTGLQVSSSAYPACQVTGNLVWAFSYTQQGSSEGQPFTICTTGLLTTSQATTVNGQRGYTVLSASGSRQVTVGSDLTASGNTVAQSITGIASTSVDGADNFIVASSPFLTSKGVTFQLSSAAVYPAGSSSQNYVTVLLSGGSALEKAGVTAAQLSSTSAFSVTNSQTLPLCPATQSFSWCFYAQSALAADQAASHSGQWNVTASGTFTTALAVQTGRQPPQRRRLHPSYPVLRPDLHHRHPHSGELSDGYQDQQYYRPGSHLRRLRVSGQQPHLHDLPLGRRVRPCCSPWTPPSLIPAARRHPTSSTCTVPKPVEASEGTAAFAYFNYAKYTPGSTLPTCSATSNPTKSITYTYTATTPNSLLSWTSCVSAVLTVAGPYATAVPGRNAYTLLGATGTRTYTLNGVSTVQSIVGVSDVIGDHTVYDAAPYSIYQGGIAFILSSNATFPGVTSAYNVLYIGDPNNYGYTIETDYERNFVSAVVSSVAITSGSTAPNSCPTNQGGNTATTLTFAWTYSIASPATNSVFGVWSVCASGQLTVSNVLQFPNAGLAIPAYPVLSFTGTRVYTDSRGSTVQQIQSLLADGNANLAANDPRVRLVPVHHTVQHRLLPRQPHRAR